MNPDFWAKANQAGIDISSGFDAARLAMSGPEPVVFITGKAGTGKSTLLQYLRDHLGKNVVTVASTGVAAVNVGGQTIHSFFGFGIHTTPSTVKADPRKANLMNALDILFIDEVSMVRADLMDCIDVALRRNRRTKKQFAFGGVKIVCFGDLYQLPPVVTRDEKDYIDTAYTSPFFFAANVFERVPIRVIELTKVHRQDAVDQARFLQILNAIRNGAIDQSLLSELNQRVVEDLDEAPNNLVTITAHKATAANFNLQRLRLLDSPEFVSQGNASGEYRDKDFPTDLELHLKVGAQVMLLNNDPKGRWVNGDLAVVTKISTSEGTGTIDEIKIRLTDNQREHALEVNRWDSIRATYSPESRTVEQETVGSFHQYPITLAWAVTVHKCQGKTFERIMVELGHSGAFASGQTYVALSRCRTLQGLYLKRPITQADLITDTRITNFFAAIDSDGVYFRELLLV